MYINERQFVEYLMESPCQIAHVCELADDGRRRWRRWTLGVYDFNRDGDLLTLASARDPSRPRVFASVDAIIRLLRTAGCVDVRIRWLPGCGGVLGSGV